MEPRPHVPRSQFSRRQLLKGTAALGAGLAAGGLGLSTHPQTPTAPAANTNPRAGSVRNLIFMVADGMSAGTLALADHACRHASGQPCHWWRLLGTTGSHRSLVSTHSADSVVTDSAAASAAWSTGVKHNNETLCIAPDGTPLTPLLIRAKATGRRVGVCTTTTITHATPAGFYASCPKRDLQAQIGQALVDSAVDLALGGGRAYVPASITSRHADIRHVHTRADLLALPPGALNAGRVIGTFDADHIRMALERPAEQPTLEESARAALSLLADSPGGFALQIEGGRVDHAAHNNDACALLAEQLEFDRVLAMVAEFTLGRPDTLLVATTDHATANPGLTLYGKRSFAGLRRLAEGRRSFEWLFAQAKSRALAEGKPGAAPAPAMAAALAALVKEHLSIELGTARTRTLERALAKEQADPFLERASPPCVLGSLLADDLGVAFISPHHAADHVELLALGAAAETFPPALDNTQVHDHVALLLGLPAAR